jgi:hypothetical protein
VVSPATSLQHLRDEALSALAQARTRFPANEQIRTALEAYRTDVGQKQ